MNKYTDKERVEIAEKEYYNYALGHRVTIDNNRLTIGYVSKFKDKAKQIYVVTDKRLGENPSIMELASVKK